MQKQYYLLALIFTLTFGMAVAALSQASAHPDPTGVYIYVEPHIIPGGSGMGTLVQVYIDSPQAWDNTANGIVGYALSVRVDPRILDVTYGARKVGGTESGDGFLEDFLLEYGHATLGPFGWSGAKTSFYIGEIDAATGTMLDISEQIEAYGSLGKGAGGGPIALVELLFIDKDADPTTSPSVIDLFGPPRPDEIPPLKINPMYLTVDGTWHEADVVTDGAYIAETPNAMYFDVGGSGFDPASPMYTDWHELYPTYCQWWTLESWEDNSGEPDGVLDESDQIDLVQTDPPTGDVIWGHVEWLNPDPVPGDGKADLIIEVKPDVPEYPLGLEVIMAFALMTPLIYLWRRKRW